MQPGPAPPPPPPPLPPKFLTGASMVHILVFSAQGMHAAPRRDMTELAEGETCVCELGWLLRWLRLQLRLRPWPLVRAKSDLASFFERFDRRRVARIAL